MPTLESTSRGTVVSIWGKAYIRGTDGVWRPLKLGEVVKQGDQIITEQNAIVELHDGRAERVPIAAPEIERAITELETGTREAAPAAGLSSGDSGDLQPGLRVDRIVENVTPAGLVTRLDAPVLVSGIALGAATAPENDAPTPVVAGSSSVVAIEEGVQVNLGLTPPAGSGNIVVIVTQVPVIGQIVRADGTPVAAGATLAPSDLPGLRYVPPADYDGITPVGSFGYIASNGTSSANGGTQVSVTPVNDAPLATAGSASGAEDGTLGLSLGGTDADGTVASVTVTALPASGTLFLAGGVTPVLASQALTPAQASGLVFRPNADFNGNANIVFTVTDNNGAVSSPANFALTVTPVNDAPQASNDSVSTVGIAPVTTAVLANDRDVDGDSIRVTGATVNAALGTAVVNADGTVTFTAAPGTSGPVVISYTIADPSGATASATLTVNVAGVPAVTVDGPALTNDSTPTITGTSNLPPGSTVTLTVTGANGAVQVFGAVVQPDGSYSAPVPNPLAEGAYSVSATANIGGNTATANDGGTVDTTAPAIAVDAPSLGNDSTPTITGTTDLPPGATITLSVTGANGAVQTFTTTVQPGGTYSADVPAPLAEGGYTVVAIGTDPAGNTGSANDAGVVDTTPPTVSVDAPALGNDTTPTIVGTTNLPVGATITLTVTGANGAEQTFTATVQPGGTYSADVPTPLADGPYSVVARATDAAGNPATANDTGVVDVTPPAITVDAPALTNDSTPTITGTTDLPPGSTVTLTVTGVNGTVQTFTATVQAGGTYSADVPAALVEGNYSVVARGVDAAGNAASANDTGVVDTTAPTLTVDAPALTNDTTPTITGTTDLPAGSTVTLTVTGADGAVQFFGATVQAGGTYSADVPAALVQGNFTVVAGVTDAAGNSASANDNGAIDTTPPVITVDAPAITNDTTPALTGTTDLPAGSTITLTVTGANGAVQSVTTTVQAGGTYTADVPAALVEGNFNVVATATDAAGNSANANDSGTIDTTPPAATLTIDPVTADNIVNVGEATGTVAITGTVGGDVRVGDTVTITVNGSAYVGLVLAGKTFSINVPGASVLADADRRIDGSVTTTDAAGNSATAIAIRDYAVNTAPVAVADSAGVGEDAISFIGDATPGTFGQDRDADGDTLIVVGVAQGSQASTSGNVGTGIAGIWGTLTLAADGSYNYVPAAAAQSLDAGETVTDTFTYTISDGRGGSATATITVSVVGADDPTTIAGTLAGTVREDVVATATGALSATDPDVGSLGFSAQAGTAGTYGTFSINAAGNWTYTLANAAANVQALAQGQSVTETFVVTADDGTTASVTVTVAGSNDAPVVSSTSINVVEEGAPVALGLAVPTDIDSGATLTITVTGLPSIGQVQLADGTPVANGATLSAAQLAGLRYLPPADYDGVAAVGGFGYSVGDGIATVAGGTTITLATVNDPPVASNASAGTGENAVLNASVPAATDVDGTIASYQLVSSVGAGNGTLAFNPDGSYSFNPGSDFDTLADGASRQVSFTYTATDNDGAPSNTATVTITVTGTNDAPVANNASATTVENAVLASSVPAALDVDGTIANYALVAGLGTGNGSLVFNSNGTYTFNPGSDFDALPAGASRNVTFTYTATDNNGAVSSPATVTITVTGTNDAPVAVADIASTAINTTITGINVLGNDIDVDGDTLTVTAAVLADPTQGTVAINPDGTLSFTPALNVAGPVVINYTVTDPSGATSSTSLTVNVGANMPPAGTDATLTILEDGNRTFVAADFGFSDPDLGQSFANVRIDSLPSAGTLTFNGAAVTAGAVIAVADLGNLRFAPAPNANGTAYASFTFSVQDNAGSFDTTPNTITFNVTSVPDPAAIGGQTSGATVEDVTTVATGALTVTDPDAGEAAFQPQTNVAGAYGTFSIDATGAWAYVLNNTDPTVQALGAGQTLTETFTVRSADGTTSSVVVTINGTNDRPVATNASFTVAEDAPVVSGSVSASDVDAGTTLSYALTGAAPAGLTFNADGTYSFNPANAAYQSLGVGQSTVLTIPYRATDDQGAVSNTANLVITVTGTNDAPTGANATITINEDTTRSFAAADFGFGDIDSGDTFTAVRIDALPTNGTLTLGGVAVTTGQVIAVAALNTLVFTPAANANGNAYASFNFSVRDSQNAFDTVPNTITVNVTAVNDAPTIATAAVTGFEDTPRVFSWADFAVSDIDSPISSLSIQVNSLPADGTLQFFNGSAWVAVTLGQSVTQASIAAGSLRFVPDANESGIDGYGTAGAGDQRVDYATFNFTASDGAAPSATGTMRVDITPVADATTISAAVNTLPVSTGLTLTRHDAVVGLNSAGSQTLANIEPAVEGTAIANTTTITGISGNTAAAGSVGALGTDAAYRASGFIYLQAGQSYTFSGNFGDTLTLEIGGRRVVGIQSDGNNNDDETFSGATYVPTVSGFYSLELITYNAGGTAGYANVNVQVGSGPVLALSTANFNLQPNAAALTAAPDAVGPFVSVADPNTGGNASLSVAGFYAQHGGSVVQGQPALLRTLTTTYGDSADNSERHTVTLDLSAAPLGTRVFVDANGDGVPDDGRIFTTSAGNTSVVVFNEDSPGSAAGGANWNLAAIVVDAPTAFTGTFNVSAISRAEEVVNGVVVSTSSATQALPITMVAATNLAPDVGSATASVSEEGLAGGLADTSGSPDTTNSATASGTISITDAVDLVADTITSVTLTAPTTAITSAGVAVTWSGAGTGTLTATAGATTVATLTINTSGNYTFTLLAPIDHPTANAEDALSLNFGVVASDGVSTGSGVLTMSIEDDQPSPLVPITNFIAGTDTNLVIMLDLSGSMTTLDGVNGTSRLASAIASINTLLDRYDEFGAVRVRLITFSDAATAQGATWVDIATAKATLATLAATGATNYDAPLGTAITAFADPGKLATGQNVAYFFSDGAPTRGSGDATTLNGTVNSTAADIGIQAVEETAWINFLNANAVRSFAIGLGAGVPTANLDPIAYDGQSSTNSGSVVVATFDDLDNSLAGTIQGAPAGSLVAGGAFSNGGQIGADGGYVATVAIAGSSYAYNPAGGGSITVTGTNNSTFDTATNTLTVTTASGGKFAIDMDDGSYRYSAPDSVPASFVENVAYTISDRDGDTRSSTITVTVDRTNTIIGSTASETLNGTAAPDYIVGRDGDDIINGNGNNDLLFGNNGNDTLNGGDGNDRLNGGAGNDLLIGGAGADTFEWKFADRGALGGPSSVAATPIDTVSDFNAATPAAGGDILDLRDLLQGETTSALLEQYLDFSVSGGTTTIRISSGGGFAGGNYTSGAEDQRIVLTGVDIRLALGLAGSATDAQIINELINRGKLVTDVPPGA